MRWQRQFRTLYFLSLNCKMPEARTISGIWQLDLRIWRYLDADFCCMVFRPYRHCQLFNTLLLYHIKYVPTRRRCIEFWFCEKSAPLALHTYADITLMPITLPPRTFFCCITLFNINLAQFIATIVIVQTKC